MYSMIRRFNILLLVLVCLGCENEKPANNLESFGENKASGKVETCLCSELTENDSGKLLKNGQPYTGNCILNFENSDKKYIEKQIIDGELSGKVIYYNQQGDVIFEERYEKGKHQLNLSIESIRCNCDELGEMKGAKPVKYTYRDQLFRGICYRYFPETSTVYLEITYEEGLRHGFTNYYNKLGDLLYTEKYEKGELIKVIHPNK